MATKIGWHPLNYNVPNFCTYLQFVIGGILFGGFLGLIALAGILFYIRVELAFLDWLLWGTSSDIPGPAAVGFVFTFMTLLVFFLWAGKKGWLRIFKFKLPKGILSKFKSLKLPACPKIPFSEDTKKFLKASYETLHDKLCYKLELYEEENDANRDSEQNHL